jgi:putative transposase
MPNYRRVYIPGGCYFFTLVTFQRRRLLGTAEQIALLREAFRRVQATRPFAIEAAVVLPDHLHCIWRLPPDDADYSGRWREIKKAFSSAVGLPSDARRVRPVWQRRFWEHAIRDDEDRRRHLDYIHYNPVRHGLVSRAADWPFSSFRRAVACGWYPADWGAADQPEATDFSAEGLAAMEMETGE